MVPTGSYKIRSVSRKRPHEAGVRFSSAAQGSSGGSDVPSGMQFLPSALQNQTWPLLSMNAYPLPGGSPGGGGGGGDEGSANASPEDTTRDASNTALSMILTTSFLVSKPRFMAGAAYKPYQVHAVMCWAPGVLVLCIRDAGAAEAEQIQRSRRSVAPFLNPPSPALCPCRAARHRPHRSPGARRASARTLRPPVPPACRVRPPHRGNRQRGPRRGTGSRLRHS